MNKTQQKSNALPIAMMFALFFMIAFVTGLTNPMGVIVKEQFEASNFQSQLGLLANFIAYAFMGIPAGLMLKRYGYKVTALVAVAVGFLGVGTQFLSGVAGSFTVYLIGAFIGGFSMCMLNTVVNPMLNTLGGGGNKGNQLIQLGGSCNSVAATIAPIFVGYLIGSSRSIESANPALFLAMGIFALVFIVLAFVDIPEPALARAAKVSGQKEKYSPFSFRHFVFGIVAIFLYVGIECAVPSIANLLMTQGVEVGGLALDTAVAGSIVGTYWFLMLVGRLIGSSVGAKVSSRAMLIFTSGLALVLLVIGIFCPMTAVVKMPAIDSSNGFGVGMFEVPVSIMLFALCGLCTSVMWGAIFNLAVEGLGKFTEAASGIFMVMVCGGGIIPAVQGLIADKAGYVSSYWLLVFAVAFLLFYALVGSKNVNKNIPVE